MEATVLTIRENVVSVDVLKIAPDGYVFRGGIKYIVEYNTYANEWFDKKHYKRFKSVECLNEWLDKRYKDDELECIGDYL